jgi:hypothetical protein
MSIKRILDAATRNLKAYRALALIIPLGYSCLCTQAEPAISSTPKTLLYGAKACKRYSTLRQPHCCPVEIARAASALEADPVCAEVDLVGLTR